ncbi:MAG: hypothetical protein MUF33_05415 [Candidatus Nanopelagicales bacterium]|nr:hypothetical protein [Candidatus Nanopelagicales bacterium]MCU0297945.1 hypothetical protein [Candidatus Nanopelagicales bacterium]
MRRTLPLLSALLLILTPPALAVNAKPAPMLPPERPYPAVLDAAVEYEGMTTCDPTPRPGALMLRQLLLDTYGKAVIGISRACDQDSISEHKEGRAVDWMVDWKNPEERKQAQDFVDWLTAKGPDGTPAANARRLGIMYIGWADEMWRAYDPARGWTELKGCYSLQSSGNDTFCHRDHVHFSMTWDGAAARTSYWDGTPVVDVPCKLERASGTARTLQASAAFVPVKPVRVFDSRQKGDEGCYLQQRRWSGDDRSASVQVAGRKGIPKSGVQAVAVRVTAYASNAPGWINAAGSPGANGPRVVSLAMAGSSAGTAIVPVSDTGRIWLATVAGHARVAVDVVGYFGKPTTAAAASRTGTWQATSPGLAAAVELPPGTSQDVHLQGVPHDGLTGVSLTLNTTGTSPGHIRVASPGAKTRADAVDVVKGTRSATTFAASADGRVTLTNTSQAPAAVKLLLTGLITKPNPDSKRLSPVSADLGSVPVGKPQTVTLGSKVPADASAVVLVVTTKGAAKSGGLTVWGAGDRPTVRSVDIRSKRSNTDLALVALDGSRTLRLAGDVKGTATLRMVGVIR